MTHFNVDVVNRNNIWTITSSDFIKILRSFMDERTILAQMCVCAKRNNRAVWFWQNSASKIDMYYVKNAGGFKKLIDSNGDITDKLVRIYECQYARTQVVSPTLVIDVSSKDFDGFLSAFGITPISKLITAFNGPLNSDSVTSQYELQFSTSKSILQDRIGSYITKSHTLPENGKSFELKFGQITDNPSKTIELHGGYVSKNGVVVLPRNTVMSIAAQSDILKILTGQM